MDSILPPHLLPNLDPAWSRNPSALKQLPSPSAPSSPKEVKDKDQNAAIFPRTPTKGKLPDSGIQSAFGNNDFPTPPAPNHHNYTGISSSITNGKVEDTPTAPNMTEMQLISPSSEVAQPGCNTGTQDLVAALNNCFSGNDLSPNSQINLDNIRFFQSPPSSKSSPTLFRTAINPSHKDHSHFIPYKPVASAPPERVDTELNTASHHDTYPPDSLLLPNNSRRSSVSDASFGSVVQLEEDTHQLNTDEGIVEFTRAEVAPVTAWRVEAVSEEQRRREAIFNTSFLRQSLAALQIPIENTAVPKFGAVPYEPASTRSERLIDELFGPGDPKRGKTWFAPKFRTNKATFSSASSVAEDASDVLPLEDAADVEDEDPPDSLAEGMLSDEEPGIAISGASSVSVAGELLQGWESDSVGDAGNQMPDSSLHLPTEDDFGILSEISTLLLDDVRKPLSEPGDQSEDPEDVDAKMDVELHLLSPQPESFVESPPQHSPSPKPFSPSPVPDIIPQNQGSPSPTPLLSFGQPHLLSPYSAPLTPGEFFGLDRTDDMEEPLAPTTEIEELSEDPVLPSVADVAQPSTPSQSVTIQNNVVLESKSPTSHSATLDASSSGQTTYEHKSCLRWSSLQLTILDTKSSAWSEENLAALQEKFGTFDELNEDETGSKIGFRPTLPVDGEDVWYEFSEEREGIELGSDQEEVTVPLFLPSDSESESDKEVLEISDDELLIPAVATLSMASLSSPTSSTQTSSKRRRRKSSEEMDIGQLNAATPSASSRRSKTGKRRPFPQSYSSQVAMDMESEEDQLREDAPTTPMKMGPPPRKRKKLTQSTPSNPNTPTRSSSRRQPKSNNYDSKKPL